MRILQVVTLLSPDGAYGGPARVALNQGAELISRGHDVTVAAATRGYTQPPTALSGVPLRLFKARTLLPTTSFAGMGAPALTRWFHTESAGFDIVHIHFGRDLVVLPVAIAAHRRRVPYVLQTHGMVIPSRHPLAPPLDAVWTRRVLRDAGAVFYLTERERGQLAEVGRAPLPLVPLGNGVPIYPPAVFNAEPPEVLFAARMHPRKRPLVFVDMAKSVLAKGVDARFSLIGPDEGEGDALRTALARESRISWAGALDPDEVPRRMAGATVYVLPSVREPYPMSVLEAMSVGLPVVISDDCGLASFVARTASGIVAEPTVPALTAAVTTLLADPAAAAAMGGRGRAAVQAEHGMKPIGDRLINVYSQLADGHR
jgi:glycosyltransferase involved in cell wall biosynthesis